MSLLKKSAAGLNLGQAGWKYYNLMRKKAVDKEFSLSGLIISLSIAFFIVAISASTLSLINHSLAAAETAGDSLTYLSANQIQK